MSELIDNRNTPKIETLLDDLQRLKRDAYAKLDQALNVDLQTNETNDTKLILYNNCLQLITKALDYYAINLSRLNQNENAVKIAKQLGEMKSKTKERIDYFNKSNLDIEFINLADDVLEDNTDDDVIIIDSPNKNTSSLSNFSLSKSNSGFEKANEVYLLENGVQQFNIASNGSVTTPSHLTDLSIYTFDNDSQAKRDKNIYGFIKVGDWMYPIVPNQSPGMKTNYNAYIFPNNESDTFSFVGITFDSNVNQDQQAFFEDILTSFGVLIQQNQQETPQFKQPLPSKTDSKLYPQLLDEKSKSKSNDELNKPSESTKNSSLKSSLTAENISKALLTGAQYIQTGVNTTTNYASKYMDKGSEKLIQTVVPNTEPTQMSSTVKTAASTVRYGSHLSVRVSSFLVDKLKSIAGSTARTVAPHIRSGSSYLLKQTGVASDNSTANSYVDSTCKVAHSAVEGFALVYDSLENAAKQLGKNFTEHTVTVVNHKYGSDAAKVAENSLYSVGNVAQSVNNFQNLKVMRTLAKATAKETLKSNKNDTNLVPSTNNVDQQKHVQENLSLNKMNSEPFIRSRITSSCSINDEDSETEFDEDEDEYDMLKTKIEPSDSTSMTANDKRKSRNQNEKKRRDKFNNLIQELSDLLSNNQKVDKTTILSETLDFFKNYNDKPLYSKEIDSRWKPSFISNDEFMKIMIDFQNVFCLVFDLNGQIKYVSNDITHLLGHHAKNVQNCKLFDFLEEKYAKHVKNILRRKFLPFDVINFNCKFKKGDNLTYEFVHINGFFKRTPNSSESVGHFNTIARVDTFVKIREIFPSTNFKKEFISEFSFDLKFKSLDSKAFDIIGYCPMEVLSTSLYDLVHFEDIEKLTECHKKLLEYGQEVTLAYRLLTKGQQWLLIRTKFQLSGDQVNMRSNTIIAINKTVCLNEYLNSTKLVNQQQIFKLPDNIQFSKLKSSLQYDNSSEAKSSSYTDETENKRRKLDENKNYEKVFSKQISAPAVITPDSVSEMNFTSNQQQQQQQKPLKSQVESNEAKTLATPELKVEKQIDKNLESIFLKSYKDLRYRNYVINQLECKRLAIHNMIKKNHTDLKILQETIDNIKDEKKLADWVEEFQRNEIAKAKLLQQQQQQAKQSEIKQEAYQPNISIQDSKKSTNINVQQQNVSIQGTFYLSQQQTAAASNSASTAWNSVANQEQQTKTRTARAVSDSGLLAHPANSNSFSNLNMLDVSTQFFNTNTNASTNSNNNFGLPNDFNLDMENLTNLNPDLFDKYFKNFNS